MNKQTDKMKDGYTEFPTPFGSSEYTLRGVNDKEIRYKQYTEKTHNNADGV